MRPTVSQSPFLSELKWNPEGLIPAIVQDRETNEVLMMAWMNGAALQSTLESGQTHFYSRSRRTQWHKGETSGHVQYVDSIALDCDGDVLLIKVHQVGGACHEGYRSCFFRHVNPSHELEVHGEPVFDAQAVYPSGRESSGSSSPPPEGGGAGSAK